MTALGFSPTSLTAAVETSGDQLLVFSQIFYPGWQVSIDGQPAELLQVNVVQTGVVAPAGHHTVQLVFKPASFGWGIIISIVGVLILVFLIFWPGRLIKRQG